MNTAFTVDSPAGTLSRMLASLYVVDLALALGGGAWIFCRYALIGLGLLVLAVIVPILLFLGALLVAGLLVVGASAHVFTRPRAPKS